MRGSVHCCVCVPVCGFEVPADGSQCFLLSWLSWQLWLTFISLSHKILFTVLASEPLAALSWALNSCPLQCLCEEHWLRKTGESGRRPWGRLIGSREALVSHTARKTWLSIHSFSKPLVLCTVGLWGCWSLSQCLGAWKYAGKHDFYIIFLIYWS